MLTFPWEVKFIALKMRMESFRLSVRISDEKNVVTFNMLADDIKFCI